MNISSKSSSPGTSFADVRNNPPDALKSRHTQSCRSVNNESTVAGKHARKREERLRSLNSDGES
jgi:hypothetical protein